MQYTRKPNDHKAIDSKSHDSRSPDIAPPLTHDKGEAAVKMAQAVWNKGDVTKIVALFSKHCEWRDNQQHLYSRDEILSYLSKKSHDERHYQVRAELWNHSFFRLAVSFQSEWQHSTKDSWFRLSGHIFIRLDCYGLIKEFCLSTHSKTIKANERIASTNDVPIEELERELM